MFQKLVSKHFAHQQKYLKLFSRSFYGAFERLFCRLMLEHSISVDIETLLGAKCELSNQQQHASYFQKKCLSPTNTQILPHPKAQLIVKARNPVCLWMMDCFIQPKTTAGTLWVCLSFSSIFSLSFCFGSCIRFNGYQPTIGI